MKTILLSILIALGLLSSCNSLHSVTTIDPAKSFVLGQGKHGSYKARVQNVGEEPVEVFCQTSGSSAPFSLGILKPGQKAFYPVPSNSMVMLKNLGSGKAQMQLVVKGDTDLSMGYQ
jgi:hypothetical protein